MTTPPEPVPVVEVVISATTDRLGPAPPPDTLGWHSWAEEAAATLCAWWNPLAFGAHAAHHPCRPCRTTTHRALRDRSTADA